MTTTPEAPTTFNLRDVLRDAIESTTSADPADVARAAFVAIDPADRDEALRQALDMCTPSYVAATRATRRGGARRRKRHATKSRRVERARDLLISREFSPFRNEWIHFGDATVEDLRSMAAARYLLAEQLRGKGDWLNRCADMMERHGAATFADLPDPVREELDDEDVEE